MIGKIKSIQPFHFKLSKSLFRHNIWTRWSFHSHFPYNVHLCFRNNPVLFLPTSLHNKGIHFTFIAVFGSLSNTHYELRKKIKMLLNFTSAEVICYFSCRLQYLSSIRICLFIKLVSGCTSMHCSFSIYDSYLRC